METYQLRRRHGYLRFRHLLRGFVWLIPVSCIIYPALRTFSESLIAQGDFSFQNYREFFFENQPISLESLRNARGAQALWGSVSQSLASVMLAGLIGIPLALLFEKYEFPGKRVLGSLAFLPLLLPPIVGVVAFDLVLSETGILPMLFKSWLGLEKAPFSLSGRAGIIAVHGYSFFPFFFLTSSSAIRNMDASLMEASRGLGFSRGQTFARIVMPLLTPALYAASLMVFMASMASFSAPLLFDVEGLYLSTHIYNLKTQDLWPEACAASTLFMLASLMMLLALRRLQRGRGVASIGKGVARTVIVKHSHLVSLMVSGLVWGICLLLLLPHLGILLWSFTQDGSWTYQALPPFLTLENYRSLFGQDRLSAEMFQPFKNSLWMAGLATFFNLMYGIAAAYTLKARGVGGKTATDLLTMLPWALPGTVIAINLIQTAGAASPLTFGFALGNSIWLLPIAYFIRNIPLTVRPLAAAWEQMGENLEEAARSLGAGRLRMLWTILMPLSLASLLGGGLLTFVTALGEFMSSAILYTPANKPIAMAIYGEFHAGSYGACSAYGVLLVLLIGLVMIIGGRRLHRAL